VLHLKITGAVEYLDNSGRVTDTVHGASQRAIFLSWCARRGAEPAARILGSGLCQRNPQS
jgi:hypothetical protein